MAHRYYISNRKWRTLGVGVVFWIVLILLIWRLPPDKWWVEVAANMFLALGLLFTTTWVWGSGKWGLITTTGIIGLLWMRRWGLWDEVTVGGWLIFLGLLTLVN
ncbi:hypothetical protein A2634_00910 [Candidatus Amesbacteria bacterium RIFCSPHIGHO2_01_FULL_48_32]|uniref:Uncharacterized protein n=1 Tax=Candidatus Amesbacteria bacterium RIFCSPLOWO2_01_FULL_48_25 TaxID=1797259 RepID=A0A1F4ZBR2_9BACT|nr:MAG: hypothetical protein A2634_00910 [Candidatus Amesbacteria bacterium RIFCSPHIGHO2_01_FULL_48_32]OGD03366.1 MAG: hypothetical protein A2989_00860 [Candidatus Amesbacteria bacterium RIFCSPLOWO2_01_FULL_48_25]HJZ05319.1 hypothetical protein [Patescibacteria group bacterium]